MRIALRLLQKAKAMLGEPVLLQMDNTLQAIGILTYLAGYYPDTRIIGSILRKFSIDAGKAMGTGNVKEASNFASETLVLVIPLLEEQIAMQEMLDKSAEESMKYFEESP